MGDILGDEYFRQRALFIPMLLALLLLKQLRIFGSVQPHRQHLTWDCRGEKRHWSEFAISLAPVTCERKWLSY